MAKANPAAHTEEYRMYDDWKDDENEDPVNWDYEPEFPWLSTAAAILIGCFVLVWAMR